MNPLVTVILPSYNHASYIGEAIESVLQQSHENIELIVIDDGSSDNSVEIVNSYSDSRIKLIEQSNKGAHNAINRGLKVAVGEYLTILNSDDRFHPNRFEKFLQVLSQSGKGFCFSNLEMIDSDSELYRGWRFDHYHELCSECRQIDGNVFLVANIAYTTSNFFFSREAYEWVGEFYGLRYTHDWNWILRYTSGSDYIWLDEMLMDYRVHESNTLLDSTFWSHLFEDSYNFACYLHCIDKKALSIDDLNNVHLNLLVRNESYVAVAVALFLSYLQKGLVADDRALLQLLQDDTFKDRIITLVKNTNLSSDVFLSYKYLSNKIFLHDHYKKEIAEKEMELHRVRLLLEDERLHNLSCVEKAKKKLLKMLGFSK